MISLPSSILSAHVHGRPTVWCERVDVFTQDDIEAMTCIQPAWALGMSGA